MNITQAIRLRSVTRRESKGSGSTFIKKILAAILISLALVVLLPVFLSFGAYGYLEAFEIILPGVEVGGVPLEGLAVYEAVARLNQNLNQGSSIIAVDSMDLNRTWVVSPSEFGLSVDAQVSAERAYAAGREAGVVAGVEQMLSEGWQGAPVVSFDPAVARATLEAWAERVNVPVIEGTLSLEDGNLRQIAGKAGKELDVEASLALIAADPAGILLEFQIVPLVMVPVEPQIWDVSSAASR
jgi:hypothetical protein